MPNIKKELLDELLRAGQLCSNICYNLSQKGGMVEGMSSDHMKAIATKWDTARGEISRLRG